jgi:hypothetical protein
LYEKREKNFPCVNQNVYNARKRRHKINKILTTLDCVMESVINICQIMVYLIPSKNLLVQYISFTLMIMVYSIPIPMSYLLNEKRVKDAIIQSGWTAGIKSIFYSTEKIRKLETERFLYLKDKVYEGSIRKVPKVRATLHSNGQHVVHATISETDPILRSQQVRFFFYKRIQKFRD